MKCYALMDTPSDQLERYFKLIYCSVSDYKIISENTKQPIKFTTIGSKHDLIKIFCQSCLKLIEFKSEKDNFNDNTLNNIHINDKTSIDIEIYGISGNNEYDVVYMSTYTSDKFYKDFIKIHEFLKADDAGLVIIGNLIPLNYEEQMKEPEYEFIEDGIVKRDREWTGDKWKIVYYILKKYNNDVILNVFKTNNTNEFVGVIQVKAGFKPEINMDEVDKITYFDNFNEYCSIINSFF